MQNFLLIVFSATALIGATSLLIQKSVIYSALSLISVMLSIAALFILMNVPFIGVLQILLYAGAIMVLFLFIIMLINPENTNPLRHNIHWVILNIIISLIASGLLAYGLISYIDSNHNLFPPLESAYIPLKEITLSLFTTHLLSLEIIAILLTAAVVGSLLMAVHFTSLKAPTHDH